MQALRNELTLTREQLRAAEAAVVEKEEKAKMYIRHAVRETAAKVELKFQKKVAKLARRNAELERLHSSTVRVQSNPQLLVHNWSWSEAVASSLAEHLSVSSKSLMLTRGSIGFCASASASASASVSAGCRCSSNAQQPNHHWRRAPPCGSGSANTTAAAAAV